MGLLIGGDDHDCLFLTVLSGQAGHHLRKDALVAPPLSTTIKRLVRTIFLRRISPTQAIAIDEDNSAQNPLVIDPRLTMRLGEESGQACHLRVSQPEEIAHVTAPFSKP